MFTRYLAEEILRAKDVEGREGVLETAEGSEWENVLLTTPEDAAPAVVPPKVSAHLGLQLYPCNHRLRQGRQT